MKESYAKMIGEGLKLDFDSISFELDKPEIKYEDNYIKSSKINNYWLSVCAKKADIKIKRIRLEELIIKN